jgi:hypothetical protein
LDERIFPPLDGEILAHWMAIENDLHHLMPTQRGNFFTIGWMDGWVTQQISSSSIV